MLEYPDYTADLISLQIINIGKFKTENINEKNQIQLVMLNYR